MRRNHTEFNYGVRKNTMPVIIIFALRVYQSLFIKTYVDECKSPLYIIASAGVCQAGNQKLFYQNTLFKRLLSELIATRY